MSHRSQRSANNYNPSQSWNNFAVTTSYIEAVPKKLNSQRICKSKPKIQPLNQSNYNDRCRNPLKNILPLRHINSEVEVVQNLNTEFTCADLLRESSKQNQIKLKIEQDLDLQCKRLGLPQGSWAKKRNENDQQSQEAIDKEWSENEDKVHSKEFFIHYETMKNEKKQEDTLKALQKSWDSLNKKKDALYKDRAKIINEILDWKIEVDVWESTTTNIEIVPMQTEHKEDEYDKRNNALDTSSANSLPGSPAKRRKHRLNSKKRKADDFVLKTHEMKERTMRNEKKKEINEWIDAQYERWNPINTEWNNYDTQIQKIKLQMKTIRKDLLHHYWQVLYSGVDCRTEGLVWVIKSIWALGENIKISFFPSFWESDSIDYLFTLAHGSVKLGKIKEEIEEWKTKLQKTFNNVKKELLKREEDNDNNNFDSDKGKGLSIFWTSVSKTWTKLKRLNMDNLSFDHHQSQITVDNVTMKQMKAIWNEYNPYKKVLQLQEMDEIANLVKLKEEIECTLMILKKKHLERIFKECIENKYEEKHNVIIDTIVAALVGELTKDKELVNYYKMKKDYNDNMSKIKYFTVCKLKATKIGEKMIGGGIGNEIKAKIN